MCRYFIEKIQVGLTDSGIPDRNVLVTIQYHKNDNPSQWLSNADCGGICNIFLNDYNAFELLLSGDAEDPQWGVGMTNSFEGIDFFDYEDMFEYFLNNQLHYCLNHNHRILMRLFYLRMMFLLLMLAWSYYN